MSFSWDSLPKPFFALAPMEGATDTVFRQFVARLAPPDVFFTEFTNVQGLFSAGHDHVAHRLRYVEAERPIIAQVWGIDPELFERAGEYAREKGFDGLDINMGCPDRVVVKKGMCSGLIKTPDLALELIHAAKKGAKTIPVSVKTRLGFQSIEVETWIRALLTTRPAALTIHFRTVKEMSLVPAHWEQATRIVELRDEISPDTVLIGNGDVSSRKQGEELATQYGLEGVMIGRGVFHNPYVFDGKKSLNDLSRTEKIQLLLDHTQLFHDTWGGQKNSAILKRFVKIYVNGFPDAGALRDELMRTTSLEQLQQRASQEVV